jgi:hypothetical protein
MADQAVKGVEAGLTESYDLSDPLSAKLQAQLNEYDELDENGRVRHVFACAGLALYSAQCFETELKHLLLALGKAQGTVVSTEEFDALDQDLSEKTLGRLLNAVEAKVTLDANGKGLLNHAHQMRNTLCHGWFYAKAQQFMSSSGRRSMCEELLRMVTLFEMADGFCGFVTNLLMKQAGVTEEMLQAALNKMMDEVAEIDG